MRLIIEIDMKGAAFDGDAAGPEVARILKKAAGHFSELVLKDFEDEEVYFHHPRNINGNICGSVRVED